LLLMLNLFARCKPDHHRFIMSLHNFLHLSIVYLPFYLSLKILLPFELLHYCV
jgi:hypothetical protein